MDIPLPSYVTTFFDILSSLTPGAIGFNWVDYVILVVFAIYGIQGFSIGFVTGLIEFVSFVLSFASALKFYTGIAKLLHSIFAFPIGISNALGFFIVAVGVEVFLKIILAKLFPYVSKLIGERKLSFVEILNNVLGFFVGIASGGILLSFLLTLIVSLPVSLYLTRSIAQSKIGSVLVGRTQNFEKNLQEIFGRSIQDTINFTTVSPGGDETIRLNFKATQYVLDSKLEKQMFDQVNEERLQKGLPLVALDNKLVDIARSHSKDMVIRGYFSHYNPDGESPTDRMYGVVYSFAGENLALAPSVDVAMRGLMQSPGHRANILSAKFTKLGVGAVDVGVYGIMFTQEFTD